VSPLGELDEQSRGTSFPALMGIFLGPCWGPHSDRGFFLFKNGLALTIAQNAERSWLLVLGGFVVVSWVPGLPRIAPYPNRPSIAALAVIVVAGKRSFLSPC